MNSFTDFFNKNFLSLDALEYIDKKLFFRIINGELAPSPAELINLDIELSNPKTAKKYFDNEEELNLIKQYQSIPNATEGLNALNTIIENQIKFIYLLVKKAIDANKIQEEQKNNAVYNAVLYLKYAIDSFLPDNGVSFINYAKYWILAGIEMFDPIRQQLPTINKHRK